MVSKFRKWFERLVVPSPRLEGAIDRIEARALTMQVLALIGIMLVLSSYFFYGFHSVDGLQLALVSSLSSALLLVPVFFLARTKYFRVAAALLWTVSYCVVIVSSLLQPRVIGAVEGMNYLVIPMMIGSAFFSFRTNYVLFVLTFVGVFTFSRIRSDIASVDIFDLTGFLFTVSAAIFVAASIRRQTTGVVAKQQLLVTQYSKLAAMGEMAAGVAHEINNPLAIIQLNVENLVRLRNESGEVAAQETAENLRIIKKTTDRIATIVQGMLSISREGGRTAACLVPLRKALEQVSSLSHERFARQRVLLRIELSRPEQEVWGDLTQIEQILLNLLNNAYDAVLSEHHPARTQRCVRVRVLNVGNEVRIQVANSGPLIEAGAREKLFQPFFTTKPPGKGTGLGLSVSRSLAESQGGALEHVSDAQETTFELRLRTSRPEV